MRINMPAQALAVIVCLAALAPTRAAHAQSTAEAALTPRGLAEVVLVVADVNQAKALYQQYAQWEVIAQGRADAAEARALGGGGGADEIVMGLSNTGQGYVRLIQFDEGAGPPIREGARPFDHGGFMDVNARVKDLDTAYRKLTEEAGCVSYSQPLQYGFGTLVVKEALLRCHDGVDWALLERVSPPLQGMAPFAGWSFATNATITVADYAAARRLFIDQLGFAVVNESLARSSPPPGTNILGLPNGVAEELKRDVGIFSPGGAPFGTVEILSFGDLKTADVRDRAAERRRGVAAVRFEVPGVDQYAADIAARGAPVSMAPTVITLQPYGRVRMIQVDGPENTRIQFFSRAPR